MASSRKKYRRRKTLSTVFIVLAVLIAGAAVGVKLLRQRVTETYGAKNNNEIQQANVTVGSISTTISGSGTVAAQELTEVTLPASVSIRTLKAEEGAFVQEGDILAYLDLTSILTAMNEIQSQLDALDDEITEAAKDAVGTVMKATVTGRVKAIYCQNDDSVLSVMYQHGALLTISLNGYMAVDITATDLKAGDQVSVTLSDGSVFPATVDEVQGDLATVLITDNKPLLGDEVTVRNAQGQPLGGGQLYIHQPLNITGYAGTVSRVAVAENTPVTKGRVLLYLTDTTFTANYDALLKQRETLAKDLNDLICLYTAGVVRSPIAGKVESITDEQQTAGDGLDAPTDWAFATVCPQEKMIVTAAINESNILSVEVGQTASVTISSISDKSFTAKVTAIEKTGTSNSGVTNYSVEATLDRTEQMLPRMSASVAIRIEGIDNALLVPEDAVTRTRDSAYVYTAFNEASGELEGMVKVKTGLTGGGYMEITEGLKEGDTVYYTKKQPSDFRSFMGGFGGGNSGFGGNMPGSGNGSGSGSNRPRRSGNGGANGGQP